MTLPAAALGPAVHRRLPDVGGTQAISLTDMLAAMRARGLRPHRGTPTDDEAVARRLWSLVGSPSPEATSARGGRAHPAVDLGSPVLRYAGAEPEASAGPSDFFGVAEPTFATSDRIADIFGSTEQLVGDLRDMGAGAVRRCKYRDVYWGSVFPNRGRYFDGELVPPPAEILSRLRADGGAALAPFTELLLACLLAGIQVAITPFDSGGGSVMNIAGSGAATRNDRELPLESGDDADPVTWAELLENKPAWQLGVRVPSTLGFDPFYWDHDEGTPTTAQRRFQRFALQVWPTWEGDLSTGTSTHDAYARECARRKSLAVAAFCQGVAEHLAAVHEVWQDLLDNRGIYAVVTTVELGNELNGLFRTTADPDAGLGISLQSQYAAGRYMWLVATPFRELLPSLRFRAAELSSWNPTDLSGTCAPSAGCCVTDTYLQRLRWLRGSIGTGMVWAHMVEITNATTIAVLLATHGDVLLSDEAIDWFITCLHADYWWPPFADDPSDVLVFPVTSLVHEVGFHWFHDANARYLQDEHRAESWVVGYQDAARLVSDVDLLQSTVVDPLAGDGFDLVRTVGAVGFAAVQPGVDTTDPISSPYYDGTTPLFQAGMIARYLCLFRTAGATRTSVFTPYLKPLEGTEDGVPLHWEAASLGTGLHNDVARPGEESDFAALGAWRRPAWFTWRRVAWLLSQADDAGTLVLGEKGLTVLRYRLRSRLSMRPTPTLDRRYRYLWVAWIDQYADSACLHRAWRPGIDDPPDPDALGVDSATLVLSDAGGLGYELVPLVPAVSESPVAGDTDDNGYRQVTDRDWYWTGWDGAITAHGELDAPTGGTSKVYLSLRKASPDEAPAPVAALTDADSLAVLW